ncbi:hypothetical protein [Staphylothermus hellenicus]|uniref:Solute-binding protein family 5 domain-containing protein n=1 Tax=Staphylothermus hellenicus (strain DSM 12710 / JCM 10830 / BK20S6-10-b1 / P8) TaxID=591019 RepID=D7DBX4_STAHD|nr:hypothetical protein [Staphylothermus hellenicus]ADI31671.1 hypothetical protein Shell_0541 [Staphylothermus hellenicus DSM 12710]
MSPLYYDPGKTSLQPHLLSLRRQNKSHTVWVFHLRRDAKFHDGTHVTAKL